jgi:glutathione-regulated potassium-efflux system ancillary protein KefF
VREPAPILVVHAHPYPGASRAGRALLAALEGLPATELRALYSRYPDFDIDAAAEREALARAGLVVWMHPLHWYGAPALLVRWFEVVLAEGWAFGPGGTALEGKDCLWAVTTGGDEAAYSAAGRHRRPFADFAPPVEGIARYCGMNWLEPFVLKGAHTIPAVALTAQAHALRARLEAWQERR